MAQHINTRRCLSEDEEIKIDRLYVLLDFLGVTEIVYFVITGPFKFDANTGAFHDGITDRVVSPSKDMIDLFYTRLYNRAIEKIKINLPRSRIKGLQRLLVKFNKLDFLPIAL